MNATLWWIIGVVAVGAVIGAIYLAGRRSGSATTDRSRLRRVIKNHEENQQRQKQFDADVDDLTRECHERIPRVIQRVRAFLAKSRDGEGSKG